jgi:hypothetical protein
VVPSETGDHLNLSNWRRRTFAPAAARAGVKAPADGRHSYASLLIHEGRSPLLVAAALGHSTGELVWKRYGHVFGEARLAPAVSMVAAVQDARASIGANLRCTQVVPAPTAPRSTSRHGARKRPRWRGLWVKRETGLEPATLSLEGRKRRTRRLVVERPTEGDSPAKGHRSRGAT